MKKIHFLLPALLAVFVGIASCDKEDYTGQSTLQATDAVGTLTWSAPASITETDTVFPFKVTLDKPQIVDVHIYISQTGGNATAGEDFSFTDEIIIPAFRTEGSGELKISNDTEIEGTETITLKIGDDRLSNLNMAPQSKTIELLNAVSPDLDLTFDWSGNVMVDTTSVALCDAVDIDIFLGSVDEPDFSLPYAATADCPEHLVMSGLPDGEYYVWANLWASSIAPADGSVIPFPVTTIASQAGLFENEAYSQAENNIILSTDEAENTFKKVVKITKSGINYTIVAVN